MLPSVIDAVIFDCDGVLFASEPLHMRSWHEVLGEMGHDMPLSTFDPWIGKPCGDQARHYEATLQPPRAWEVYLSAKTKRFHELIQHELHPFDGVPACLDALRERLPIAFATSTTSADMMVMLELTDLLRRFQVGVMYEDVTHHKPHPEAYLTAAQRLGVDPARCVALDDSPTGIASARDAGMCVFGIASSFDASVLERAHRVFSTTVDACAFLLGAVSEQKNQPTELPQLE